MAVQGPFTIFNEAKLKSLSAVVNLSSDSLYAVLCNSSQVISAGFTGTSTNCQYSDLTGELATANGYTAGGLFMPSVSLTLTGGVVTLTSANLGWTLTGGGITLKYVVIRDYTATNGDLIAFCDMDTSGGSVSPIAGAMQIDPSTSGILNWN